MAVGITHRPGLPKPYRAEAWDNAAQRRIYKSFPTERAAINWRRDMQVKIARGEARAFEPTTVREAWLLWIEAARAGKVRARGGQEYKPGVLRTYELAFEGRILKKLGHVKVGELRRVTVQRYIDELVAEGLAAQTVRNTINALRVMLKWCVREEAIAANPCDGVELPSGGTARDRIVPAAEAIELLGKFTRTDDRAIYATAFFAGLRRGELMGLEWQDVGLTERTITVRRSYDPRSREFVSPKSKAGARTLGIPELLVPYLAALDTTEGRVFPSPKGVPFSDRALALRAAAKWLTGGIGLHEARHTYASLMIAANVNIKTISEWMGHSSVTITLDRYGHLLPGSAAAALGLLNDYLAKELS